VLRWLHELRSSLELAGDSAIASLLRLNTGSSSLSGFDEPVAGSSSSSHCCIVPLLVEARSRPFGLVGVGGVVEAEQEPGLVVAPPAVAPPAVAPPAVAAALSLPSASVEHESRHGLRFRGNAVDNFAFLDWNPSSRDMALEAKYTHGFRVRGLHYMEDRVKFDAGPAMGRLVGMDMFLLDKALFGDRCDHICSFGKCRARIEAMAKHMSDLYVIFVYCLQIPGDPPASLVFYFAVPTFVGDKQRTLAKAKKMLDRFLDIPVDDHEDDFDLTLPPPLTETTSSTTAAASTATADTVTVAPDAPVAPLPYLIDELGFEVCGEATIIVDPPSLDTNAFSEEMMSSNSLKTPDQVLPTSFTLLLSHTHTLSLTLSLSLTFVSILIFYAFCRLLTHRQRTITRRVPR
jgi:hypothetical protein